MCREQVIDDDALFLISSSGVPRHATTSGKSGDTDGTHDGWSEHTIRTWRDVVRTIIPHCYIRDDLLQHRLSLHELFILRLRRVQLCAKFLHALWNVRKPR